MKNRIFLCLMVTLMTLFVNSCKEDEVVEVSVQVATQGFAQIGQSTAFVSAYITKGTVSEGMVGFCWSESSSPTVKDDKVEVAATLGKNDYMLQMTGLTPATQYYVRAYINDGSHVYYGNELEFTTKEIPGDGWCVIDDVVKITPTTATALMEIADNGGSEIVEYGVCYTMINETPVPPIVNEPTIEGQTIVAESGGYKFEAHLEGLSQNTHYLVRPYFKTEKGVVYGETLWFKTMNFVKTGNVFPGYRSAYLSGEVLMDAGSPTTERGVCWGVTQEPVVETDPFEKIDKGIGSYYSIVSGLKQGTTYYVRAYARNADGVFYGLPIEFTTRTGDMIPGMTFDDLILVQNGTFDMGNPNTDTEASPIDNKTLGKEPVHRVKISKDFYMCRYEVTVEQMCVFLNVYQDRNSRTQPVKALHNSTTNAWSFEYSGATPNLFYKSRTGKNRFPAVNITWQAVEQYCEWLSAELGVEVRLPSEAEWEYAARGGNKSQGYIYSGSNNSSEVSVSTPATTAQVGTKNPNELGIYDMTGNAMEYCRDFFDWEFYKMHEGAVAVDPVNAGKQSADGKMIVRGGSFRHPTYLKVYARGNNQHKGDAGNHSGFRFVMEKLPDYLK